MEIFIGADYRGFEKKQMLIEYLKAQGHTVTDEGAFTYSEGDDFNDPAIAVAKNVRENRGSMGILICDSAHGVTMQANRFRGIRAAHCDNTESAILAREHDDANVLCLSAHFMDDARMRDIVMTFLTVDFTNLERRVRRINRLDEREDYD
ncbi:RpiB/LacA/LacB family sugar-phosphate isomerase [Candidatus Saccharibacteria bacterium]|nr:RpiB/LacA/LacB family sugar-phosphate isomerase [Candidatus Saccharibacteria bacterium]MBQ6414102.1 RpiB/LacA/LacB family sugar-phosphate isomerase [Candidatus Saccharibacteria bacterium]